MQVSELPNGVHREAESADGSESRVVDSTIRNLWLRGILIGVACAHSHVKSILPSATQTSGERSK